MPVAPLQEMCVRRLVRMVRGREKLIGVHDAPYSMVRDALLRVESPKQLRDIEKNSPQIVGEDGEIWLGFIKRDIPNWEKREHQPREGETWGDVYDRLEDEHNKEVEASEAQLAAAVEQQRAEKKSRRVEYKDTINDPKQKKRKAQDALRPSGKLVDRLQRETRMEGRKHGFPTPTRRGDPLATPQHQLAGSRITQIPPSMLPDHLRPLARERPQAASAQPTRTYPSQKTPADQPPRQTGPSCLQAATTVNRKRKVPDRIFVTAKRAKSGGTKF